MFLQFCAECHEPAIGGAPTVESMNKMPRFQILESLKTGVMATQGAALRGSQIEKIVEYLAAKDTSGDGGLDRSQWLCEGEKPASGKPLWTRWGIDQTNTRYVPANQHGFDRKNVAGLQLKWAFGFPDAVRARSQPVVTETMLYTGSQDGTVYALDRQRGCVWWTFAAEAEVRSSLTIVEGSSGEPRTLYFGDFEANVYAVGAETGELLWKRDVAEHKDATITGSIAHFEDKLFVPMSSTEIISAYYKEYACCTFRGGVLALSALDGKPLWRMFTTEAPTKRKKNSHGVQLYGPSGAPVWSAPTVDAKRGLLYVGTGENYSTPANEMSDAIIAIELESGKTRWVQQTTKGDAWNGACVGSKINCPEEDGPDFDFGAPPILTTVQNKDYILAGQKSGMIYAMDPEQDGQILWQRRMGMGGFNGGVHWGMAVSGNKLLVPITDTPGNRFTTGEPRPGMHALDIKSGEPLWSTLHEAECTGKRECFFFGLSASITTTDDLVFAGNLNGDLAIYHLEDGKRLWSYATRREFETVNQVEAQGGTLDSDGVVLAGTQMFVNSGYDKWGEFAGNVLLAFELP